ncbi:PEPxxWA-CTERM sorting domain-containing protein [Sphingomonas sp. RS6]
MGKTLKLMWLAALAAAGLAAGTAPATAADFITDQIDLTVPGGEVFGGLTDDGEFSLIFNFIAPIAYSGVRIEISSTAFGGDGVFGDIDFDDFLTRFDGVILTVSNDGSPDFDLSTAFIDLPELTAGPHQLVVAGRSVGFGLFTGTVILPISPVPEPATWATLLLGFAAIGIGLRAATDRRRPAIGAAHPGQASGR